MRFKKLAIAATIALALTACGSDDDTGGDTGETGSEGDIILFPEDPATPSPIPSNCGIICDTADDLIVELQVYQPMVDEIQRFWSDQYVFHGVPFASEVVDTEFLTGTEAIACGDLVDTASNSVGPAYCTLTDVISVPTGLTTDLVNGDVITIQSGSIQINPAGEAGVFFLLAHEWGHNIQYEIFGAEVMQLLPSVSVENNADCLGGVAIAGVERVFEIKDVEAILQTAIDIGEPLGGSHGTPQERFDAVSLGMLRPYEDKALINQGIVDCFVTYFPELTQQPTATIPPIGEATDMVNGQDVLNEIQRKQICIAVNWPNIQGC